MSTINGESILNAYKLVADCGKEVDSLVDFLKDSLLEALSAPGNGLPCVPVDELGEEHETDAGGGVYTDWLVKIPLKPRGKGHKRMVRCLAFQVSMLGAGCDVPGNNEPLLHVFCWDDEPALNDDCMHFPLMRAEDEDVRVVNDRLIVWGGGEPLAWDEQTWAYSIKLVSLHGSNELHTHVVEPVLKLLKGHPVKDALPAGLEGVLRYPDIESIVADL